MEHVIIPARKNSNGLPNKNHFLVPITLQNIPDELINNVIVSTDDEFIVEYCKDKNVKIHHRSQETAKDTATMKSVIQEVISDCQISSEDIIIVLYPTYIGRSAKDIIETINFHSQLECDSTLCCYKAHDYPEMFIDSRINDKYRRQDIEDKYVYSHYVAVVRADKIEYVDAQLRNKTTTYNTLSKKPKDIDTIEDLL